MLCPYDKEGLRPDEQRTHRTYGCRSCRGHWVPSELFKSLEFETRFRLQAYLQTLANNRVESLGLECPVGCGEMATAELKSLRLDWCEKCHGIWFDENELTILHDQFYGNGVAEEAASWLEALLESIFFKP